MVSHDYSYFLAIGGVSRGRTINEVELSNAVDQEEPAGDITIVSQGMLVIDGKDFTLARLKHAAWFAGCLAG